CNLAGAAPGYIAHQVAGMYEPTLMPPLPAAVKLDSAVVRKYEGVYQLEEDKVAIKALGDAGHLQATFAGRTLELLPQSETDFFEEDADRTYHFTIANGKVTGVDITVPERIVFRKVD